MSPSQLPTWLANPRRRPLVMGILNVTPDSFSDGGKFSEPTAALLHAEQMLEDGADWIDVGAESTRPGSTRVSAQEQIARIEPVVPELRRRFGCVLSIDTTRVATAAAAADWGADIVNDISGAMDEPAMLSFVASRNMPIIVMHMQGQPATMQIEPTYKDVTREVSEFLADRLATAESASIKKDNVLLDPGIGFGKRLDHNLALIRNIPAIAQLGRPVVVGVSRKRFIGAITGEDRQSGVPFGTAAAVAWSIAAGAAVVRVHDVKNMSAVVKMVQAIKDESADSSL